MTSKNNNNNLKNEEVYTIPDSRNYQHSADHHYEYYEMGYDIISVRVDFRIRKERLKILEQIIDLKHSGFFMSYIEEAIMNQVEADLNCPESIALDFCKSLLKRWNSNNPGNNRKSLQNPVDEW
jgi:hypothetical protein